MSKQQQTEQEKHKKPVLVLVAGYSGAGLATAIKSLEDMGYYCIDNLPFEMVVPTLALLEKKQITDCPVALGIHIHSTSHAREFIELKKVLQNKAQVTQLFLTAEDDVLLTRFGSSRRRHPLLSSANTLTDAIESERRILAEVELQSDVVIDTSALSPHNLARIIESRFQQDEAQRCLFVSITSFGFKYGMHKPLDSLFDVRFLKNPYFVPSLKDKTGLDKEIKEYLFCDKDARELLQRLYDWHAWILPKYYEEGKHIYRVGIACTGGRHRSVFVADELHQMLKKVTLQGIVINVSHRDIDQDEIYKYKT
jgi:RNase adapter protein RapZ